MDAIGKGVEDPLSGVSGCIEAKCVRGGGGVIVHPVVIYVCGGAAAVVLSTSCLKR